mgnify:CR=1 FL=1|tara:strand:- start:498 stop:869 length:372 start_codon:yes stop_codon:yes gene_type:complete
MSLDWKPDIGDDSESIVCVWPGLIIESAEEALDWFKDNFGVDISIIGIVKTLPDPGDRHLENPPTGGRTDFFFRLPNEDIGGFAIPRLQFGIRWWEDIFFNKGQDIYPDEFIQAYPCPVGEWA